MADSPEVSGGGQVDPHGYDEESFLRERIDNFDEAIIRLVLERAKLSARIQTARINSGGARVQLGRERVVLDAYRAGLGEAGPALGDAILQISRGKR